MMLRVGCLFVVTLCVLLWGGCGGSEQETTSGETQMAAPETETAAAMADSTAAPTTQPASESAPE